MVQHTSDWVSPQLCLMGKGARGLAVLLKGWSPFCLPSLGLHLREAGGCGPSAGAQVILGSPS